MYTPRRSVLAAVTALVAVGTAFAQTRTANDLVAEAKKVIKEVSAKEAQTLVEKGWILIDVREADEYAAERVVGAIHMSRGMLEFVIEGKAKDRSTPIIIYCKKDGRGALAVKSLMDMGYIQVVNVIGGLTAWQAAGLPIEKGKK